MILQTQLFCCNSNWVKLHRPQKLLYQKSRLTSIFGEVHLLIYDVHFDFNVLNKLIYFIRLSADWVIDTPSRGFHIASHDLEFQHQLLVVHARSLKHYFALIGVKIRAVQL